jgi:hypothetical protein
MSMEVYVFLKRSDLPLVGSWQQAVRDSNFPVDLYPTFDPAKDSGFVPCKFRDATSGFEYFLSSSDDIASSYPDLKEAVRSYDSATTFSWGSRLDECAVALIAAATLAALSSGVMYDPQDGLQYDRASALKYAQEVCEQLLRAT